MIDWILIPILTAPLIWELINDKKGDVHPNNDWLMRGMIMVAGSIIVSLIGNKNVLQAFALSFGLFFLLFDYLFNIIHKKPKWWSYLNTTAFPDNIAQWSGSSWYARLLIRLIVFGTGFSLYFWEEMQVWNYPYGH